MNLDNIIKYQYLATFLAFFLVFIFFVEQFFKINTIFKKLVNYIGKYFNKTPWTLVEYVKIIKIKDSYGINASIEQFKKFRANHDIAEYPEFSQISISGDDGACNFFLNGKPIQEKDIRRESSGVKIIENYRGQSIKKAFVIALAYLMMLKMLL